jgi:hypothetical protein
MEEIVKVGLIGLDNCFLNGIPVILALGTLIQFVSFKVYACKVT